MEWGGAITSGTGGFYVGDLAELFLFAGTPIDITDPRIVAGFDMVLSRTQRR
jgi:hypothetical protein